MENEIEGLLKRRIAEEGPLPFSSYMEAVLYHPMLGYYSRLRGLGAAGDFVTSPEIHPVFGCLIGRQALDLWEALGRPPSFPVLEMGGGSGALAESFLDWAEHDAPDLARAIAYWIEEPSASLRRSQHERLGRRLAGWGAPPGGADLVLANEVVDALPVDRAVYRDGTLYALRVGLDAGGALAWNADAPAPPETRAYLERLDVVPREGAVVEMRPGTRDWVAHVAGALRRGLALVIDYGDTARRLYARPAGTLLTYYRHTLGSDPLVRVGEQDVTAHVDFSLVAESALAVGLDVLGVTSQRTFLQRLGWGEYARLAMDVADRGALGQLVDAHGLGRLGVLALGKGLGDWRPVGSVGERTWPVPAWLPWRAPDAAPDPFLEVWRDAFGLGDQAPPQAT